MSFGLVSLFAFLAAVGAAWTLRNKFFAIFVGVLLGLEGLVATAYEPHVGALRPLFWGLHVTVFLQILSLTRPALRPAWFRVLVSWPAYYFLAATLLGVFWLPILLVASAPASLPVQLVLSVPFVLAAVGMWQSLVGRRRYIPFEAEREQAQQILVSRSPPSEVTHILHEKAKREKGAFPFKYVYTS